ncbi:MAG: hypothetical protein OEW06_05160 [Gemmatimonadota bacterium]|nr:hypothetical protein [Gemmatimonadota bacterium]MDH4352201.1 hypothetical protein [Gemmatimonadota bacterium]
MQQSPVPQHLLRVAPHCRSLQEGRLGQQALKQEILAALPPRVGQVETCVGALAQSRATYCSLWMSMQIVQGVLGQGGYQRSRRRWCRWAWWWAGPSSRRPVICPLAVCHR